MTIQHLADVQIKFGIVMYTCCSCVICDEQSNVKQARGTTSVCVQDKVVLVQGNAESADFDTEKLDNEPGHTGVLNV